MPVLRATSARSHATPAVCVAITAAALVACSSASSNPAPPDSCGTPPPMAAVVVGLAYPPNGTSRVSTNLPQIVLQGYPSDSVGPLTISLDAGGAPPGLGAATAPPSPLPSPLEAHPRLPATYFALPLLGVLAPNTAYSVTIDTLEWSPQFVFPEAPRCTVPFQATLGRFHTGS